MRTAALLYHEIQRDGRALCSPDPGYAVYCVSERAFGDNLVRLQADDVRGVSVGEYLDDRTIPRTVVFTFDDGCETDLLVAAPALERVGFGATFFVTVEHVGRPGYLSRPQLVELHRRGFEIGSHSLSHRYLGGLSAPEVEVELAESRARLEEMIGAEVREFSFPGGRFDKRALHAVRAAGYRSAVTSRAGFNDLGSDPMRLRRFSVRRGTTSAEVSAWAGGRGAVRPVMRERLLAVGKTMLGDERYERMRASLLRKRF